jgi:DNA-binding transcriptional regulator/RsmH inhibitor MraZ
VGNVTVIELDKKGRALLPAAIRKKLNARRFEARLVGGHIELIPLEDLKSLRGKYKSVLRTPWNKLEEMSEKFVREGRR